MPKFEELSPEAKEKAIEDWRTSGHAFDSSQAEGLTEFFKEELSNLGFYDPKVYWGLSYTQGDGVCFEGRIDPAELFKQRGFARFRPLIEGGSEVSIAVKVPNTRYCHQHGMDVEVELTVQDEELMSRENLRDIRNIREEHEVAVQVWRRQYGHKPTGRLHDWSPDVVPAEPTFALPPRLALAQRRAKAKYDRLEALAMELQEFLDKKWVRDLSVKFEKMGYAEIEYHESDKAIAETFEANDFEFTEEGERI